MRDALIMVGYSADVLATVVRTVHSGGRYVDPQLAAEAIGAGESPLTAREAHVLALAAEGAPVEEIARQASPPPSASCARPTGTRRPASPAPTAGSESVWI